MRAVRQTTLAKSVTISGVGLHSGTPSRIILHPETSDSGVTFHRLESGLRCGAPIAATIESVSETRLGTCLRGADGSVVRTVEHLLAAVSISGIDNLAIEIDGAEIPIVDGSAGPFLEAIERAGRVTLPANRSVLTVTSPIEIVDGDRFIRATPAAGRILIVGIDFSDKAIGRRSIALDLDDRATIRRIANARTFCRLADIEEMRSAGLGLGGSLDNAIVVSGDRILNDSGLRDPDEFVLHKALDIVGDLALAGAPIVGRIEAMKPGHDLNTRFLRLLTAGNEIKSRSGRGAATASVAF